MPAAFAEAGEVGGLCDDGIADSSCWEECVDGIPPDPPLSVTELLSMFVVERGLYTWYFSKFLEVDDIHLIALVTHFLVIFKFQKFFLDCNFQSSHNLFLIQTFFGENTINIF